MVSKTQTHSGSEVFEFPASSTQASLWVLHQMMPDNSAYNIPLAVKITGALNVEALEQSVRMLVQRHEILRTRYTDNDGHLVQHIYPEYDIDFRIVDNIQQSAASDEDAAIAAEQLLQAAVSKTFDLAGGEVFRAGVIATGEHAYIFYLVVHHIAVDHGAMLLISNEISQLYAAIASGSEAALAEPELQYADYVMWLKENQDELQQKIDAWHEHLADVSGYLNLPFDRTRPAIPSGAGAEYRFSLSPSLSTKVEQFSRAQGVSLYITCLAAFKVLMARYSNQSDVVVGTPFSFRGEQEELQSVVGCIMNTLPLASVLNKQLSFNALLAKIKRTMLFAYQHQDVPFEVIVDAELEARDFSANPLFQVGFVFQEPPPVLALEGLQCEPLDVHSGGAMYDIHQWMWQQDGCLHGVIWYSSDIYDSDSIGRMQACYECLLHTLIDSPEQSLWQVALHNDSDTALLNSLAPPVAVNTPAEQNDIFINAFVSRAAEFADRRAAIFADGAELSYRELDQQSNQLANVLDAQGVQAGDAIGICMTRTPQLLVALLAVMKSGAAYLPLDPGYPFDRLSFMVETSAAKLILTNTAAVEKLNSDGVTSLAATVFDLERETEVLAAGSCEFHARARADGLAYVIFTSGSTGKPKGVQVRHDAVANFLNAMRSEPGFESHNRLLAVTTLAFDIAVLELYLPLLCGGCVVVASAEQAADSMVLNTLIDKHAIDVMQATPSTWRGLMAAGFKGGEQFKALCGGEAFPTDLAQAMTVRCAQVWNMYGPTETTVWSSCYRVPGNAEQLLIGRPIANTQCYVLDDNLQRVPVGVAGELYIGGLGVASGYLSRPDLTAERFIDNPFAAEGSGYSGPLYRTGDLVKITHYGELAYLNRLDDQVKLRGFRMELGEIETVLAYHASVAQAVLRVVDYSQVDQRLVAYVLLEAGSELDEPLLMDYLRSSLPDYMLPQAIVSVDALPKTANGKIDRNALPKPQWQCLDRALVMPQTPAEKTIATIWRQVLALADNEQLGINSDFFGLGGHSLLAVSMLIEVNEAFSADIRLRDFIVNPSIENLARLSVSRQESKPVALLDSITRPNQIPMSSAQRHLWYVEQFADNFSSYNIQVSYAVDGSLQPSLMQRVLNIMVARHENLRTVFETDGEIWVQAIADSNGQEDSVTASQHYDWVYDDLSQLDIDEQAARIEAKQYHYSRRPFDLTHGPLWGAELTALDANKSQLYFVFHHSIFDGLSADNFITEFVALYTSLEKNEPVALAPVAYQFADYVLWQQSQSQTEAIQRQYDYWQQKLSGDLPSLNLPADYPRPAEFDFLGDTSQLNLNAELIDGLNSVASQSNCSLFVVLLTAYQLLLAKYSQQDDVLVGCPVAERGHSEFADAMGLLVNTLVLRTHFTGLDSFGDLLADVRDSWHQAIAHSDLPFDDLVDRLQPVRDVSQSRIFQTVFAYHKVASEVLNIGGKTLSLCRPSQSTARTDVTFWLEHYDDRIEINCEYSTSIFAREFAEQFLLSYQHLLEQIVSPGAIATRLNDISVISPSMQQCLDHYCGKQAFVPAGQQSLAQLLSQHSMQRPQAIAVTGDGGSLSYSALEERSNQLANHMIACGVESGDFVAIAINRHADMLVGLLGALKAGAAYVPLDPDYPKDRLAYMLEAAQVKLLLTESTLIDELPAFDGKTILLDQCQAQLLALSKQMPAISINADANAYVIFTSGSTGKPKGVEVPHRTVINFLQAMAQRPGFDERDKLLAVTTLSFDIAVLELYLPLFVGGTIVIASRDQATDASRLADLIEQYQVTVMQATPSTWRMLVEFNWPGNAALKVLCGGEAFPKDLAQQLLPRVGSVWNMYGPTETTVWSTCFEITDATQSIYIGKPIRNTSCYILDTALNPVPPGVAGELYIGGDGVTNGYLHRPDLTAERFLDDPFIDRNEIAFSDLAAPTHKPVPPRMYRTGDKVRWRYDGELEYFNRIDNQVKVRGFRIELGEIESQILAHEAINDCAVVLQMVNNEARLVAFYTCLHDETLTMMQLREFLSQALPRYMLPNHFILEQRLPLTPSGKIDRKALALRTEDNSVSAAAMFKAPVSATEKYYAKVWAECLSIDSVSLDDNFFDIGGHSLMATRVVARVSRDQGVNLELRSLLMNTLAQIALQYPLNIENDTGMENCVIDADNGIGAACSRGSGINVDSGIIARINYKLKQFLGRL